MAVWGGRTGEMMVRALDIFAEVYRKNIFSYRVKNTTYYKFPFLCNQSLTCNRFTTTQVTGVYAASVSVIKRTFNKNNIQVFLFVKILN